VSAQTGYVDYDALAATAEVFRPRLIVCGSSAYPRDWDYQRLRQIADDVGSLLMCDMAHFSGLVAAQIINDPFKYAHIVTTTTHKSLRGPRAGMIFYRKDNKELALEEKINFSVFPSVQGGPHNNAIAAIAVQLKEVNTPEFVSYAKQIVLNAKALAESLIKRGHKLVTNGTDTHLVLWDLRPYNLTGNKYESVCDLCNITVNKNSVFGDASALAPGGVRIGTPALTSRGFKEKDFVRVAEFLHRALEICLSINKDKMAIKDFKAIAAAHRDIQPLKNDVETFASKFYMPGF